MPTMRYCSSLYPTARAKCDAIAYDWITNWGRRTAEEIDDLAKLGASHHADACIAEWCEWLELLRAPTAEVREAFTRFFAKRPDRKATSKAAFTGAFWISTAYSDDTAFVWHPCRAKTLEGAKQSAIREARYLGAEIARHVYVGEMVKVSMAGKKWNVLMRSTRCQGEAASPRWADR